MTETIAIAVICFVIGYIIGGAGAYDKGWKAGMNWAHSNLFGVNDENA